jgi:polyphenol oxidase
MTMIRFRRLENLGEFVAVMSDKSEGDCSSNENCRAEREAFLARTGIKPEQLVRVKQVHGNAIQVVDSTFIEGYYPSDSALWPQADGLVTDLPNVALGISVADCVPILAIDPQKKAIGAFHAGREGTLLGIAKAAVVSMLETFNSAPENLFFLIGPSAGPCCYELSEEMATGLSQRGLPVTKRNLDLWETNRRFLVEAGVTEGQIELIGECTICGGRFHSYRADHGMQRNLATIMIKKSPMDTTMQ